MCIFFLCVQRYTKFRNFARLYFYLFLTFCHQALHVYKFSYALITAALLDCGLPAWMEM